MGNVTQLCSFDIKIDAVQISNFKIKSIKTSKTTKKLNNNNNNNKNDSDDNKTSDGEHDKNNDSQLSQTDKDKNTDNDCIECILAFDQIDNAIKVREMLNNTLFSGHTLYFTHWHVPRRTSYPEINPPKKNSTHHLNNLHKDESILAISTSMIYTTGTGMGMATGTGTATRTGSGSQSQSPSQSQAGPHSSNQHHHHHHYHQYTLNQVFVQHNQVQDAVDHHNII